MRLQTTERLGGGRKREREGAPETGKSELQVGEEKKQERHVPTDLGDGERLFFIRAWAGSLTSLPGDAGRTPTLSCPRQVKLLVRKFNQVYIPS